MVDWQLLEQVKKFKYMGAWITEDCNCESKDKVRIGMAKDAFNKRRQLLVRSISHRVKKKIIKSDIWLVAL